MKRLALTALLVATLSAPANASAATFFLFDRSDADPNDRVTVRIGGTPKSFTPSRRVKPFQRPMRLYLVRNDVAAQVHSRLDRRLTFVGSIVPDKNFRGLLTFSVPPLDAGTYTLAYWCPACATYSRGETFFVQRPEQFVPRYRSQALLSLAATASCPVTLPNGNRPPGQPRNVSWYGNGLLFAGVASAGVRTYGPDDVDADGAIGDKLLWVTTPPWQRPTLSGERLDAPAPPLRVLGMNQGSLLERGQPVVHESRQLPVCRVLAPEAAPGRSQSRLRRPGGRQQLDGQAELLRRPRRSPRHRAAVADAVLAREPAHELPHRLRLRLRQVRAPVVEPLVAARAAPASRARARPGSARGCPGGGRGGWPRCPWRRPRVPP